MRRKVLWLVPVFLFLGLLSWSPAASAHAGHVHAAADGAHHASSSAVRAVNAANTHMPCDCPSGHCVCGVDCFAHCATVLGVFEAPLQGFFPSRAAYEPAQSASTAGGSPRTDDDPPRPSA